MKKSLLLLSFFAAATVSQAVDTAYSPPVGGMTISVPAGQTRAITLPLLPDGYGAGKVMGTLTGVGTNYVEDSTAGWTDAAYSSAANPYFVRITSGAAAGRVIPVSTTANTATRIYLSNDGMAVDQIVAPSIGDRYELVFADTLGSFFGSSTLQGGPDYLSADNVQIWGNTAWVTYYFNTTRNRWERSTDTASSTARDNTLLRQDRGFMIVRRASTALSMSVVGRVPGIPPKHNHLAPGVTFFGNGIPVSTTLGNLALQTQIPSWRGATSGAEALTSGDLIQIWGNTAWVYYYYDTGRQSWQRSTDTVSSASRDTVVLTAGQAFMLRRLDSPSNQAQNFVTVPLPYSL